MSHFEETINEYNNIIVAVGILAKIVCYRRKLSKKQIFSTGVVNNLEGDKRTLIAIA
ncbi:uncharacterized protein PHALS_01480 [Plasmopara halstedii]|uniref:Uncharacterized protein n=1 Tax=Plasmopara halstedii TaxID=4781 RepID=A0A0N7L6T4_PLAHL|nr:uncharacterized protein PHALS_01480 [Plasmopara halstedii]CEG45163.1 hypothetical protein PHALS_01480 [Plasmopara halstedii]|eukprot:XP_024581532.1 hypothetical protein PHALS_01480 [Plasmopara halstedii]